MSLPKLEDCHPGMKPTGFNVLVRLPDEERISPGGIIIPPNISDRDRLAQVRGRMVALSPAAFDFADFGDEDRPHPGDAVMFAKFAGIVIEGADKKEYRLLQDRDITAIIEEQADG